VSHTPFLSKSLKNSTLLTYFVFIGIPSISVPFGVSSVDGYPIGLQLMTQYGDEDTLLGIAKVLEKGANQKQNEISFY